MPNRLAINTTVTSEIPSHIGNEAICTIIRENEANRDSEPQKNSELSSQWKLVHCAGKQKNARRCAERDQNHQNRHEASPAAFGFLIAIPRLSS